MNFIRTIKKAWRLMRYRFVTGKTITAFSIPQIGEVGPVIKLQTEKKKFAGYGFTIVKGKKIISVEWRLKGRLEIDRDKFLSWLAIWR